MSEEYLPHLWIPDEEVEQFEKKTRAFTKDRDLDYGEHGATLSSGLQNILTAYSHLETDSLREEDLIVFKMVLPEGEDIYAKRDIAEKEGLKINAVKDKRHAVVSTSKSRFERLQDRVGDYRDSGRLKHFQFVDSFEPYTTEDKEASSLKKFIAEIEVLNIDVQMMFIPNLDEEVQDRAAGKIIERIQSIQNVSVAKRYKLSDGTVVIRANLPVKELKSVTDDPVIYRVEQTGFFQLSPSAVTNLNACGMQLDPEIDVDALPIVAVLDSGVYFPDDYSDLIPVHWKAQGVSGYGGPHGTEVASKVIFSHIGLQLTDAYLKPRAKVIDCDIYGGQSQVSQEDMSQRIEEAVVEFHDVVKIFNLSSNVPKAIEGDELSILGYQLDSLMKKYKVKFVISAGNHELSKSCNTLEDILDDTDARIAEPADSMLGITVGAVAGTDGKDVFSKTGEPTAYTRVGPGFAGFYKPDLVSYGANLKLDNSIHRDPFAFVLFPGGQIGLDAGTSFTAPVVAGDLAEVHANMPGTSINLAQAMLYNGAEKMWDTKGITKEDAKYMGNQYGRGLSLTENCTYSTPYKVSFLREGSLKKSTKEHVKFLMPQIQAGLKGNNTTKVTITCITDAPIDKTKGAQYLGACITASLHKLGKSDQLADGNPNNSDNKEKWDTCNHFSKTFSGFSSGMWEVWLDLFTKWDVDENMEIPYYLVITIEDLTKTNNIYEAIIQESAGRFKPIETVRVPVRQ